MKQSTEDLFEARMRYDAICITTNGSLKHRQAKVGMPVPVPRAVMGRGVAAAAKAAWPWTERRLGELIAGNGNHVHILCMEPTLVLVSFPVKHEWNQPADLELIAQSAKELALLAGKMDWKAVLLPRPGCGNGHRTWDEVCPVIEPILDDRFTVTYQPSPREIAAMNGRPR